MIEAEGAVPERLCDICDAVFAHDVEGEAEGAGHDAGVVADAAAMLVEGNVDQTRFTEAIQSRSLRSRSDLSSAAINEQFDTCDETGVIRR
jgi:hypothetical protein